MSDIQDDPLFLELPLRRAVIYSDDAGALWTQAMPAVLARTHMTPGDYWNLTVAEAALLASDRGE